MQAMSGPGRPVSGGAGRGAQARTDSRSARLYATVSSESLEQTASSSSVADSALLTAAAPPAALAPGLTRAAHTRAGWVPAILEACWPAPPSSPTRLTTRATVTLGGEATGESDGMGGAVSSLHQLSRSCIVISMAGARFAAAGVRAAGRTPRCRFALAGRAVLPTWRASV